MYGTAQYLLGSAFCVGSHCGYVLPWPGGEGSTVWFENIALAMVAGMGRVVIESSRSIQGIDFGGYWIRSKSKKIEVELGLYPTYL